MALSRISPEFFWTRLQNSCKPQSSWPVPAMYFIGPRKTIILSTTVHQWFPTFSQMNPVHSFPFYFFEIRVNIIIPCSSMWDPFYVLGFFLIFLPKLSSLHFSPFYYALHAAHPPQTPSLLLYRPNT